MAGAEQPGGDHLQHRGLNPPLEVEVEGRSRAGVDPVSQALVLAATQIHPHRPDQEYRVAVLSKACRAASLQVLQVPHHPDHGGRVDAHSLGVVVEGDVAAHHRDTEGQTGLAHPLHGLGELPEDLGLLGIAEVEAVGHRDRRGSDGDHVAGGFADGDGGAPPRVEGRVASVAVGGESDRPGGASHAQQGGVAAGEDHGVVADLVVVAPEDGPAAADVRTADEAEQGLAHRPGRRHGERIHRERLVQPSGAQRLRMAKRHVVDQEVEREVADHRSAIGHHQTSGVSDRSDHVRVEVPAVELHLHRGRVLRPHHQQHPLLRLAQHHLVGRHPPLSPRDAGDVHLDAAPTSVGQLGGRAGEPGRPQVLHGDDPRVAGQGDADLHQALLEKGVADLDRGTSLTGGFVELDRGEGGAMDAVTAGVGTDQQDEVAGTGGGRPGQLGLLDDADAHGVDQAVVPVGLIEVDLATDGGDADAVAVAADAGHDAIEEVPLRRFVEWPEAQ